MGKPEIYKRGKKKVDKLLKIDFLRFGIVGATGFTVSMILLYLLHGRLRIPYTPALLMSNEGALISNFIFHETWTYKHVDHSHRSWWQKFTHFHLSSWTGVALIFVIGIICVKILGLNYLIGQVIASAVVMFWNFFWTKYYIFKGRTPAVLSHPEEAIGIEE